VHPAYFIPNQRSKSNSIYLQGESIRKTFVRLRKAAAISFEKPHFEKLLADLREYNYDLKELRCQINELQQPPQRSPTFNHSHEYPRARYELIQKSSQKLHEALADAWKCQDSAHFGHYAKLCVDAEVGSGVQLKMAVSYHRTVAQNTFEYVLKQILTGGYCQLNGIPRVYSFTDKISHLGQPSKTPQFGFVYSLQQ